ncbi:MAG: Beta-carotene 15,15'-dioxygenase [Opitutia bacterium UBA7350]|nr:MAG: Beta-carotene 15,15'-dioxygenase [Opitutae bacterium UBA7350]
MKFFFQWTSLSPPSDPSKINVSLANGSALCAGFLGLAIVLLGMDSGWVLYLPILASSGLFGLPHGAIDHLVVLGLANRKLTLKSLVVVCLVYLLLVIAMLGLWWASPIVGVSLFLLITIYHWGKADLAFEHLHRDSLQQVASKRLQFSHALLRGFFPIGLPFLTFPEATEAILNACSASFGYNFELNNTLQIAIFFCFICLLLGEVAYLSQQGQQWKLRLVEDLGLAAFFAFIPPLLAVGLYFCLWHGFRHVLRLIRYEGGEGCSRRTTARIKRFYCQAFPFTFASILLMAGFLSLLPNVRGLNEFIGIYLVIISALTVPHLLVVEWMDQREAAGNPGVCTQ